MIAQLNVMINKRQVECYTSSSRRWNLASRRAAPMTRRAFTFNVGDVISLEMASSENDKKQYGEVVEARGGKYKVACRGRVLQTEEAEDKATVSYTHLTLPTKRIE